MWLCVGVARKSCENHYKDGYFEMIFSQGKLYRRASEKKKEQFQNTLRAAGMQRCLLGCSKTLRSMWNLLMWYMFFLRISYYRDAERVKSTATCRPGVRRRFVSPKITIFERESRKWIRPHFFALCTLHFELGAIELFLHEKYRSLAHSQTLTCMTTLASYILYGVFQDLCSFELWILQDRPD